MINFHYSQGFYLMAPFALLIGLVLWNRFTRLRDYRTLADNRLLRDLIPLEAIKTRRKKDALVLLGLFFLLLASTGPQFGNQMKEVKQRGMDVFIAMDTSRSMLAEDVPPSRIERAKRSLGYLIQKLGGNRIGVIAFAQFAIIQCPLTTDIDAAQMFLEVLNTNTVPVQGTSIGDAIRLALKSMPKDEKGGRALILLTDGEDHRSDPAQAAKEAKEKGVIIFTIGIGTSQGDVIKNRDEGGKVMDYHKYKGEMVLSRLDDALLTKIAEITGGKYYRASSTDKEIDEIADTINGMEKREFATKRYERFQERYQIFALLAFFILMFEFFIGERRGQFMRLAEFFKKKAPVLLPLALILLIPRASLAALKDEVRRGNRLVKKGDMTGARAHFESARIDDPEAAYLPYNIANTYYLEGNFDEAKRHFEQAYEMAKDPQLKSFIAYNLGHLLFSMKDKPGAIEKFKTCLKLNPKDMDAKYNIEYIKSGKEPKNPPQPQAQQGSKNQEQDKEKQKGSQSEQENKGEEKKEGEMSKEDAERILQMLKEQENEKMREQKMSPAEKKNDKKDEHNEDW